MSDVAACLAARFAAEGMEVDPAPVAQPHLGPMQYRGALGNDLWRVAVFPGADGWTVVKSARSSCWASGEPVRTRSGSPRVLCFRWPGASRVAP